jgi:transcriptional regulator with XRE-family HTH domain
MSYDDVKTSVEINYGLVIQRITEIVKAESDGDIAEALGVTPQTFSTWKRRKTIPYEKIALFALKKNVSLDYILLGRVPEVELSSQIDREVAVELVTEMKSNLRAYFRNTATIPALSIFVHVYNMVCHIKDPGDRLKSAEKQIALLKLSGAKSMLKNLKAEHTEDDSAVIASLEAEAAREAAKAEVDPGADVAGIDYNTIRLG